VLPLGGGPYAPALFASAPAGLLPAGAVGPSRAAGSGRRRWFVSKKLSVGNLAFGTTSDDLIGLFGQYGTVKCPGGDRPGDRPEPRGSRSSRSRRGDRGD